jgi:hypothetical protein
VREPARFVPRESGVSLNVTRLRKARRPMVRRVARWAIAIVLILVGLVLSIPAVPGPGFVVVAIGLFVLMPESRWLQRKYAALKRRFPRVFGPIDRQLRRFRRRYRRAA